MDENRVIYKTGTSVRIKINKSKRSNSLKVYMSINGVVGELYKNYTESDRQWKSRFCVKVAGKYNPKSSNRVFWLFPEEVEIIEDDKWINDNPQLSYDLNKLIEEAQTALEERTHLLVIDTFSNFGIGCDDKEKTIKFKNGGIVTAIQSDDNCPGENYSWDDVVNMTKENKRKIEEDKRKMELLEQIKNEAINIVNSYKEYLTEKKNNEIREYREEFLKTTEARKICDEYSKKETDKLSKLFGKEIKLDLSYEKVLTDIESKTLDEKFDIFEENINTIRTKAANLYSSIRLCETRDQVLNILKHIGLVDEYGVTLQHDDIETKHFD